MSEFVEFLQKNYKGSELLKDICKQDADLEFLIEQLEQLRSLEYLGAATHVSPHAPPVPPSIPGTSMGGPIYVKKWQNLGAICAEATQLLRAVKNEVYKHYRDIDAPGAISVLDPLIQSYWALDEPAVIFTTNYDPAIEVLCRSKQYQLVDGFVHDSWTQQYVWKREGYEIVPSPHKSIVLLKLHGSTTWFSHNGEIVKAPPMGGDDSTFKNMMIYPATRKIATEDPYFTAYDYFDQCLATASECMSVGYSFRDYDTLMKLRSASLRNKALVVKIIDPLAGDIAKRLENLGIRTESINSLIEKLGV